MLAASVTAPNPPQDGPENQASTPSFRTPPTPHNWRGVEQGLKDAARLLRLHLYAQAEDELLQLLEFSPMEGKVWHLLGRCHQVQSRHAKALECFDRAACCYGNQRADNSPPTSARLARVLWNQGERAAARSMLNQLLVQRPADAELLSMQEDWRRAMAAGMMPQEALA